MIKKSKLYSLLFILVVFTVSFTAEDMLGKIMENSLNNNKIQPQTTKEWTCMIYCCADTRLSQIDDPADNSLNKLFLVMYDSLYDLPIYLNPGSENDINIIVLFDYPYSEAKPSGDAKIYEVTHSGVNKVADWGVKNMGSYYTLRDFVSYCKTNYPAYHYSLNLVDHGRGYAGFCYDYHAPHPYWEYALGDCLTVSELEAALSSGNEIDVLFLDTCSGGSFEVAWQLYPEVDYIVAGETIQGYVALCHFVDIYRQLSFDTTKTPLELAQVGFDKARAVMYYSPVLDPSENNVDSWGTVSLYSVNRFISFTGGPSFKDLFEDFTAELMAEIYANHTEAFKLFSNIRGNLTTSGLSSVSLMVDLYNFLDVVIDFDGQFNNPNIVPQATTLRGLLEEGIGGLIYDNWVYSESALPHIHGFSICFPESRDLYQGYLYPNFYEDLAISTETYWEEFIFTLFPPNVTNFLKPPHIEFYEFYLNLIDPVCTFHVYIYRGDEVYHVGLKDTMDFGMGVDIGLPGAQFFDDLLFGNSYIQVPISSFASPVRAEEEVTMKVVIDASASPTATQKINMTVNHFKDNEIVWHENIISDFEVGESYECNVTTDDVITDLVNSNETTTKKFELKEEYVVISIPLTFVILIIIDRKRKK